MIDSTELDVERRRLERAEDRLTLLRISLEAAKAIGRQGPRGRTESLVRSILLDPDASILLKRAVLPFAKKWRIAIPIGSTERSPQW